MFTAQKTLSFIKTNQSMLYTKIITVCSKVHKRHKNEICEQNVKLMLNIAIYKVATAQ